MRCLVCKGFMQEKKVDLARALENDGAVLYYIITGVPAEVCNQCGEKVFTPEVTERLLAIAKRVRGGEEPPETIRVPVYNFSKTPVGAK